MAFKPNIGANGVIHPSEVEGLLSFPLLDVGFASHEAFYPDRFITDKGETFRAKTDFKDIRIEGISLETKGGSLNGLTSRASAANALARVDQDYANGYIKEEDIDYRRLMVSWSASVYKFKYVQLQEAAAGRIVLMVFNKKPPPVTFKRLEKSKVMWCVHGDADWQTFLQFRLHARIGARSTFIIKGNLLHANGGGTFIPDEPAPRKPRKKAPQESSITLNR